MTGLRSKILGCFLPGKKFLVFAWAVLAASPALADPPPPAWFVPPPVREGVQTTVTRQSYGNYEDVTVTAQHRAPVQRNPHGEEVQDFEPNRSASANPNERPTTPSGYCGSAYQTVAGQAATGADMVGFGSGRCN